MTISNITWIGIDSNYYRNGSPDMSELRVALTAMNTAATHWQLAADHLQQGSALTPSLEIAPTEAGTFNKALEKYKTVPGYFRDRLNEGVTVYNDISTALNYARRAYEDQDIVNQGKLRQLEGQVDNA
ncbi:hypothetical protein [Nocardia sp. NPDC051832]|uniref:hypothetical protein n=1 Tax=Nocardia sp. NPDC051832 TaxID=3155673 RepID=UPI00341CC9CC